MHVACPKCGTGYALKAEMLEREQMRLRCHRCAHIWDPRHPFGDAPRPPTAGPAQPADGGGPGEAVEQRTSATAELGKVSSDGVEVKDDEAAGAEGGRATPTPDKAVDDARKRMRRAPKNLVRALVYASALTLFVGGAGGFAYAFRDLLPGFAPLLPALSDVHPAWQTDGGGRRLVVTAQVDNPGSAPATIDTLYVKFLSAQGAWMGERVVSVAPIVVEGGGMTPIEVVLEELPEGTGSLELSVMAEDHSS